MKGNTFIHLNIQSLLPKLDELKIYLLDPKIGVVSLNETWLNDTVEDAEVAVPGFTIFRNDRTTAGHGGVALYVRNELQPVLLSELLDPNIESVFIRIRIGNTPCLVGSIYRVPNANMLQFESITSQIEKVCNLNLNTILMGDFNLDIKDPYKYNLIKTIELLFQFKQQQIIYNY